MLTGGDIELRLDFRLKLSHRYVRGETQCLPLGLVLQVKLVHLVAHLDLAWGHHLEQDGIATKRMKPLSFRHNTEK